VKLINMRADEQSLLLTRTAATVSVLVVRADEVLTAFLELESLVRNEKRKAGKPSQSLLSLRKMRSPSGQARIARRDIPRDRPQA
jgi:hypothetical protein